MYSVRLDKTAPHTYSNYIFASHYLCISNNRDWIWNRILRGSNRLSNIYVNYSQEFDCLSLISSRNELLVNGSSTRPWPWIAQCIKWVNAPKKKIKQQLAHSNGCSKLEFRRSCLRLCPHPQPYTYGRMEWWMFINIHRRLVSFADAIIMKCTEVQQMHVFLVIAILMPVQHLHKRAQELACSTHVEAHT